MVNVNNITHSTSDATVSQRSTDGYLSATDMCKAQGKLFADYSRMKSAKAFLKALSADMKMPAQKLVEINKGGLGEQGTWVHPYVAINLAQWLSPEFAVQVSKWVFSWLSTGDKPAPNTPQQINFKGEAITLFAQSNQRYLPLEQICRLLNISYYNSVRRIAAQNLQLHTINAQMCIDTQTAIAWLDGIDLRHYKLIKRQQLIKDIQALRSTILSPQAPTNPHNEPLSMQYLLEKLEEVVGEPVLITTKKKAIKAVEQVGKVDAAIIDTFNLTEYSRLLSNQSAVVNQLFSGKNVYYLNSKRKLA